MPPVFLMVITPEVASSLGDPRRFAAEHEVDIRTVTSHVLEIVRQNEAHRRFTQAPSEWGGYLAVDVVTRCLVGTCAFKGAPDASGRVEIAYHTFPGYEGNGFATAMAASLLAIAAESGQVATLIAHTLPQVNASTRILTKLGFKLIGPVEDPGEGLVWLWRKPSSGSDLSKRGHLNFSF